MVCYTHSFKCRHWYTMAVFSCKLQLRQRYQFNKIKQEKKTVKKSQTTAPYETVIQCQLVLNVYATTEYILNINYY